MLVGGSGPPLSSGLIGKEDLHAVVKNRTGCASFKKVCNSGVGHANSVIKGKLRFFELSLFLDKKPSPHLAEV